MRTSNNYSKNVCKNILNGGRLEPLNSAYAWAWVEHTIRNHIKHNIVNECIWHLHIKCQCYENIYRSI